MIRTAGVTEYLILSLLASHLVSDFLLQSDSMVSSKEKPGPFLSHLGITALTILTVTGAFGLWLLPVCFFFVHGLIDLIKIKLFRDGRGKRFFPFALDQVLHLVSIIAAAFIAGYFVQTPLREISLWVNLFGINYLYFLLFVSALILVTRFGAIMVDHSVSPLLAQMETANSKRGFINGGRLIGSLERTLILLFIITGNFSAVGFLIAAKSIFRFGELSNPANRKESEYIIIGTMISFLLAVTVGIGVNKVLG